MGGDFWLKIVSFGNAPLLGLLTTIFSPESRISGGSSGAQAAVLFSLCAKGNDPNLTKNGDRPKNWTLDRDPYSFVKVPEILIDTGARGTIDETFAHKPSVITHEGALYHFYCAVSGQYPNEVRGIGVARSKPW